MDNYNPSACILQMNKKPIRLVNLKKPIKCVLYIFLQNLLGVVRNNTEKMSKNIQEKNCRLHILPKTYL